jgi:hypothetical protein
MGILMTMILNIVTNGKVSATDEFLQTFGYSTYTSRHKNPY